MQQQRQPPQVIAPTPGNLRFRRVYAWVIFALILVVGLLACLLWSQARSPVAFFLIGEVFFLTALLWWFKRQNKEKKLGEAVAPSPAFLLTEEGLSVMGSPGVGPILWDEIRAIQRGSLLGFPFLKLELDFRQVRRRLGPRGRWLWMTWVPGGLGLNVIPFGGKAEPLATQINAYRAALGAVGDNPSQ